VVESLEEVEEMLANFRPRLALLVGLLCVFVLVTAGCSLKATLVPSGDSTPTAAADATELPPEFDILQEAWRTLTQSSIYKDELDVQKLSQGAVHGMMEALEEDPYAAYLDPDLHKMQQEDMGGSFQGIGARVAFREGRVIVLAPLPGTPAERAGLRPGDVIMEVDGQSTLGMNLYEVVMLIRGPRDTSVSLDIRHPGEDETVTVTVVRDLIDVLSVTLEMLPVDVAHLRIEEFSEDTDDELSAALGRMDTQGARGLLLDLRNNPGGLLTAVVQVASYFLRSGLVLYEEDSQGVRRDWQVEKVAEVVDIPMVVLVNRFSASGAEVLAGALRDHDRAVLVGERTFGKGSVNNLHALSDGSAMYFTVARWYTPSGTLIEGEGLEPDFPVAPSADESGDPQLEKALELLKARIESS